MDATPANPKGEADEKAVLARTLETDRCYVVDRGYTKFSLWNAINDKGSSYVARVPDSTAGKVERTNELGDADRRAGIIRDEIVVLGGSLALARRPDHPVRLIQVEVRAHESCSSATVITAPSQMLRSRSGARAGAGELCLQPRTNHHDRVRNGKVRRRRACHRRRTSPASLRVPQRAVPNTIAMDGPPGV